VHASLSSMLLSMRFQAGAIAILAEENAVECARAEDLRAQSVHIRCEIDMMREAKDALMDGLHVIRAEMRAYEEVTKRLESKIAEFREEWARLELKRSELAAAQRQIDGFVANPGARVDI
jgi:hypothetical protein